MFTDVRVDELEGFDRIVLEFTGSGVPGWSVSYVDEAVLEGSGRVVTLGGDAVLDIYASGTTWPGSGDYSGPRRVAPANGGNIAEVYVAGTFEGYTQVLAGIDWRPRPVPRLRPRRPRAPGGRHPGRTAPTDRSQARQSRLVVNRLVPWVGSSVRSVSTKPSLASTRREAVFQSQTVADTRS